MEAGVIRRPTWEELCRPVKNYLNALVVTNRLPGQDGMDLLIIGNGAVRVSSEDFFDEVRNADPTLEVFTVGMYMRQTYLDKKV